MVAFFGGTFDPFHMGHLSVAQQVQQHYPIETFYFCPAGQNPLKSKAPLASGPLRLQMCEVGLKESALQGCEVLDWEVKREGPSFTYDTLSTLKSLTQLEILLVMGDEVFVDLPQWAHVHQLLHTAHIVVLSRTQQGRLLIPKILESMDLVYHHDAKHPNRYYHSKSSQWIETLQFSPLPFSGTEIRNQISQLNQKRDAPTPPPGIGRGVWQIIKANQLYAVT